MNNRNSIRRVDSHTRSMLGVKILKGKIDVSALTKSSYLNQLIELNKLMVSKKLVMKVTPKLRGSIRPERISFNVNSNDPTEDVSGQPILRKSSDGRDRRSSPFGVQSIAGRSDTQHAYTIKTWETQESESELAQLLEERDSIITKMTKEKYKLETELNELRRKATKSLLSRMENTKTIVIPVNDIPQTQKNSIKASTLHNPKQELMATYTVRKEERKVKEILRTGINAKLISGLNLVSNLEKCIMGIQCDIKLIEAKRTSTTKGRFKDELKDLKQKIKQLVKIVDRPNAVNV